MFPSDDPTLLSGTWQLSLFNGPGEGRTSNTDALEKLPDPALDSAFASQVWLQVDKDWPGQLSRAVLLCCYGYKGEDNFL